MIGTNPWSIAAPAGRHGVIVMDMANSGVARGKIYLARQRGDAIPQDWAIDAQGNPTTDPDQALQGFILPMAGHKGYVMGVMVDVLSGVLSGSQYLDGVHGPYDPVNRSGAGHFMLAVNVDALQPRAEFDRRMEDYIERLKGVPLAAGHQQVFYPGELENAAEQRNLAEGGIVLADTTRIDLLRIARESGQESLLPFD
jgi:LDH2 family malate/lactate/ureidoglycolate dehydrogenase